MCSGRLWLVFERMPTLWRAKQAGNYHHLENAAAKLHGDLRSVSLALEDKFHFAAQLGWAAF
jgi:hypothetical protein